MQSKKTEQKVVDQNIALDSYLSTLLDEIPDDTSVNLAEKNGLDAKKAVIDQQLEIKELPKKLVATKKKPKNKAVQQSVTEQVPNAAEISQPLSVMPEWTQHEFHALFFKVDTLILAAPLTELLRTIKIEQAPTKIPKQPSWFMGLLDTQEQRVGVLDTGQLVLGKAKGQQRNLEQTPFKNILIIQDGRWGLACDEILSIRKVLPEKVRWRTLRQKRPWLVGTVIEELTAIIDVSRLVPHRKVG
jgi:purine-binding chemotaxis protein CheW